MDLRGLCRRLSIRIVKWKAPSGFTALLATDLRAIVVNADMPLTRQRFSIAHEVGHLAHDRTGVHSYGGRGGSEKWAHDFAGELLMPGEELRRLWDEHRLFPTYRMEAMCAAFIVSREALGIRLKKTGIAEDRRVWPGLYRRRRPS